jgi:hypothetical protein
VVKGLAQYIEPFKANKIHFAIVKKRPLEFLLRSACAVSGNLLGRLRQVRFAPMRVIQSCDRCRESRHLCSSSRRINPIQQFR